MNESLLSVRVCDAQESTDIRASICWCVLELVFNEFPGKGEGDGVDGRGGRREGWRPGGRRGVGRLWRGRVQATPMCVIVNHSAVKDEGRFVSCAAVRTDTLLRVAPHKRQ